MQHTIRKKRIILELFRSLNNQVQSIKDDTFLIEALDLIIGRKYFIETIINMKIDARRAISMTYAAGDYRKSVGLQTDMHELRQSLLWEALDILDKFTDPLQTKAQMENILVDHIQGSKFCVVRIKNFIIL